MLKFNEFSSWINRIDYGSQFSHIILLAQCIANIMLVTQGLFDLTVTMFEHFNLPRKLNEN